MSRELKTLAALLVIAIPISVGIFFRMGWPMSLPAIAATTLAFLVVGFLWGALNVGLAAIWATLTRKSPNIAAAFNFGFVVFLAVQVLAQVAFEHYRANPISNDTAVAEEMP